MKPQVDSAVKKQYNGFARRGNLCLCFACANAAGTADNMMMINISTLNLLGSETLRKKFIELYETYCYECLHIARSILHDQSLAEDAVQEAFLAVAKKCEKYLSISCREFHNAIVIIVRNKCIDILRARGRFVDHAPDDYVFEAADGEPTPEQQTIIHADLEEMTECINGLGEQDRQILYMKYINGLSYREIASELGMKEKAVEVRIARAKNKARKIKAAKDGGTHER